MADGIRNFIRDNDSALKKKEQIGEASPDVTISFAIGAVLIGFLGIGLHAASFDCSKARMTAEKLVCSDAGLSKADEEMAAVYGKALELASRTPEEQKDFKANQRAWVRQTGSCDDRSCLAEAYRSRTNFLEYYVYRSNGSSLSVNGTYQMISLRSCFACFPGRDVTAVVMRGQLEVLQQSDGSVKFALNVANSSRILSTGDLQGQVPLKNSIAIYRTVRSADNDDCNLTITFKKTKAIVSQENGGCGFGVGVDANGVYMKAADSGLR